MDTIIPKNIHLLRLNKEEIENINRPIISNEVESVINKHLTNKTLGPDAFTGELYQRFREELTPIFLKLFKKYCREWSISKYIL